MKQKGIFQFVYNEKNKNIYISKYLKDNLKSFEFFKK